MVFTAVERDLAAVTLGEAMSRAGVSPAGLAERAGVSRTLLRDYLRDYLRGAKQPSVAQLARLVRSLGLEPVVDLVPAYRPMTAHDLGSLLADEPDEGRRSRLLQEFLRGHGEVEPAGREHLLERRSLVRRVHAAARRWCSRSTSGRARSTWTAATPRRPRWTRSPPRWPGVWGSRAAG